MHPKHGEIRYLAQIEAYILEQAGVSFMADVEPGKLRVVA